jgi:DNA-binding MarR family transcriptional regulator
VTEIAAAAAGVGATGCGAIQAGRGAPDREQLAAWRSFLRAHATVTRALETELVAEQRLSLAAYDVLVQLAEAPGRKLRMTELADAVLLSRSGVTRLVDRLERVGLVRRSRVADDGRGVAAELTDTGLARLRTAARTHLAGVVRHFVDPLEPADLAALERIGRRLAE